MRAPAARGDAMKQLLLAGVLGCVSVTSAASLAARSPQNGAPAPWQVGNCYRIEPANSERWYVYRVVDPLVGQFVRVRYSEQPRPLQPSFPPPPNMWLNVDQVVMVYDTPCRD